MQEKKIALAFLLLVSIAAGAQEDSLRSYGNNDGLANLAVRQLYKDHLGFLWVSTENGIYRFDGDRFQAFDTSHGVPENSAVSSGEAPDGSLLIGGEIGLYRLRDNRFKAVPAPFKTISWAQGIRSGNSGRTYLGTDAGLAELTVQPGTRDRFAIRILPRPPGTSGPQAWGVLVDGDTLWYGCGLELCQIQDGTATVIGRAGGLPARQVTSILKDSQGPLWVRVRYEGLFVRSAGRARFEKPRLPIPGGGTVGVPSVDRDGHILLPSPEGLLVQEQNGWKMIDPSHGLRGVVYAALDDRQHSLWIGTAGRGIVQWRGYGEWEGYSAASGLPNDIVYEISRQPEAIWIGTEGGLLRGQFGSSGTRWSQVKGLAGFAAHAVQFAPDDSGVMWIGTEARGVARLETRTGRLTWIGKAQGLTGVSAYTLRFDRQKRLWVGDRHGTLLLQSTIPQLCPRGRDSCHAHLGHRPDGGWHGLGGRRGRAICAEQLPVAAVQPFQRPLQSGDTSPWHRSRWRAVDRLSLRPGYRSRPPSIDKARDRQRRPAPGHRGLGLLLWL
jgi:ligand-binding sensor domain-containing protein